MSDYHLMPAYGKTYKDEGEVIHDWNNGVTFRMTGERASYIDSRDYEKYCNPMDGVFYCYNGLFVPLVYGIL
jgi:hypothetical protein